MVFEDPNGLSGDAVVGRRTRRPPWGVKYLLVFRVTRGKGDSSVSAEKTETGGGWEMRISVISLIEIPVCFFRRGELEKDLKKEEME